jgi:D-amino-acid dehydrogenase
MDIVVLGAGVIGVTTSYQLAARGHNVTVVDRKSQAASECSFANGGQLSYSHAEPWANASVIKNLPHLLFGKNSPLVVNPTMDIKMWKWCLQFLACCNDKKSLKSSEHMLRLALYSRKCLQEIESEIKIDYHKTDKGILHVFKSKKYLESNLKQAKFQEALGCPYELLENMNEVVKKEPALAYGDADIVGGIFFPIDAGGDIHEFTVAMSQVLQKNGKVEFKYDTTIEKIITNNDKIQAVQTYKGLLKADAYVVCMGATSSIALSNVGINVPIYPMKGYSISVPVGDCKKVPTVGITDQHNKIVYTRFGDILRVAGTAEFASYNDSISEKRIATLKEMTKYLFSHIAGLENATKWACLRPSTPDGSPIIGKTNKYNNLYLNTGHGTLGWTMSFASAKIITDIVDGKNPEIDLSGLDTNRFGV